MSMFDLLREPSLENMDVDGANRLLLHRQILARKPMLREVFTDFHHIFVDLDRDWFAGDGTRIELGAGIAPIRDSYPDVLATDVVDGPHLDQLLNAEAMNLPDRSVRALFGQNCFHHLGHPDLFFRELERVLIGGGGVVLLEPFYGPFATFLFTRLFKTEGFDKHFPTWETPVAGPMNGANQALSYLVFVRDRALFERRYPSLEIVHQQLVGNYPKYLLSGGLNFRQLWPDVLSPVLSVIQWLLSPLNRWLALHHVVVVRKVAA